MIPGGLSLLMNSGLNVPAGYTSIYSADSISGSTLIDLAGNYDGIISNVTESGGSIYFNGTDASLQIPDIGTALGSDFTICMIMDFNNTDDTNGWYFVLYEPSSTTNAALGVQDTSGGSINWRIAGRTTNGGSFTVFDDSTSSFSSGVYRSVIVTQDSANGKSVEVDGAADLSSATTALADCEDLYICSLASGTTFLEAYIKYLIVYPFALDSSEKATIDALA